MSDGLIQQEESFVLSHRNDEKDGSLIFIAEVNSVEAILLAEGLAKTLHSTGHKALSSWQRGIMLS